MQTEIQAEALTRNLARFSRFLEVAALCDGEEINYANLSSECGVAVNTDLVTDKHLKGLRAFKEEGLIQK